MLAWLAESGLWYFDACNKMLLSSQELTRCHKQLQLETSCCPDWDVGDCFWNKVLQLYEIKIHRYCRKVLKFELTFVESGSVPSSLTYC